MEWKAIYSDNTYLTSHNDDGTTNSYADINRDKLIAFDLINNGKSVLYINLSDKKRLIYRRRVQQNMGTGVQKVVYLVGYQQNVGGKNVQVVNHVYDDGHIEQYDTWKGGEPEYYNYE